MGGKDLHESEKKGRKKGVPERLRRKERRGVTNFRSSEKERRSNFGKGGKGVGLAVRRKKKKAQGFIPTCTRAKEEGTPTAKPNVSCGRKKQRSFKKRSGQKRERDASVRGRVKGGVSK